MALAGTAGSQRTATWVSRGTTSRSSSSRFPANSGVMGLNPRNVPTWPREARHEAAFHRIAIDNHDDGYRRGRVLRCLDRGPRHGHKAIDPELDQLGRKVRQPMLARF